MPKYFHIHNLKDGREVILHTGHPAFLAKVQPNSDGSADIKPLYWLDEEPKDVMKLAALLRRLGDWYAAETCR